jgi:hypothetical protein
MTITIKAASVADAAYSEIDAMVQTGQRSAMCYLTDEYETIKKEPAERSIKRANNVIKRGHHSVADHVMITLGLEGISKMGAMLLNSLQFYVTSEKSARYTFMQPKTELENELYSKWLKYFEEQIAITYQKECHEGTISPVKLAQENARYLISVFTPTKLDYTTSIRQLGYIMHWSRKFLETPRVSGDMNHDRMLNETVSDIYYSLFRLGIKEMDDGKDRCFDFLVKETAQQHLMNIQSSDSEYGFNYTAIYDGSYAMLAQLQRHRTIKYNMVSSTKEERQFYVPRILESTDRVSEWIRDMTTIEDCIPQGTMVGIIERGTIENFLLKAMERSCGRAQLEIAMRTKATAEIMFKRVSTRLMGLMCPYISSGHTFELLPRCATGKYTCSDNCPFGAANALNRLV